MHSNFEGAVDCHHALRLKQRTPLITGFMPPHPGREPKVPKGTLVHDNWVKRANEYARYYLVLFRPESIEDDLGYGWTDLEQFIFDLQTDGSFISKCRLMIMDNHMQGLRVSKGCERMMKNFNSRTRHLWTPSEHTKFGCQYEKTSKWNHQRFSVKDMLNNAKGSELSAREIHDLNLQLHHDSNNAKH